MKALLDSLWQLEKRLIDGHHWIKLSDAISAVSSKKLDQKFQMDSSRTSDPSQLEIPFPND